MAYIIQWNINGFHKRSTGIQHIIFNSQPSILCFQETNLLSNFVLNETNRPLKTIPAI